MTDAGYHSNPLLDPDPRAWTRLVDSIDCAALLIAIETRLGDRLAARVTPEDVLQDSLLAAWRDRDSCQWRGLRAFRSWLLTIIDHRIRNIAEHEGARKRGGGVPVRMLFATSTGTSPFEPRDWSTPSKAAQARERARAMRKALDSLEPELARIVQLRIIEEMTIDQIATHVGLDEAAIRRRLRKGVLAFERALAEAMSEIRPTPATPSAALRQDPAS